MNTNFEIINGKVNVFTDDKGIVERDTCNNIEDILICENNIEEIKKDIQNSLNKIIFSKNKLWWCFGPISTAILWLGTGVLTSIIGSPWWLATIQFLVGTGFLGVALNDIKQNSNDIKANKCVIKVLEENLKNELIKLVKLHKDKTNDLKTITETTNVIFTSKEIYMLKDRLDDIKFYINNRHKFIKLYKKGELSKLFYECGVNGYTIDFIKKLVELDLRIENKQDNSKQKILEKK